MDLKPGNRELHARIRTAMVCGMGVALMTMALSHRPEGVDDFGPFYRAARLAATHSSVYANPATFPKPVADDRFLPFLRTPAYAAMLRPLAALPFDAARRIWIAALVLAICGCFWLYPSGKRGFALALAYSFPLLNVLMVGQDTPFVVLIVLAASRLFSGGREFLAGFIASLLWIKVTWLPAAGLVFLAKSRLGTWGLLTGTAIQLAISFLVGGLSWPSEYLAILRNPLLDPEPARMPNIHEIAVSLSLPAAVYLIAAAALYVLFWFACKRLSVTDALIVALALALIASPHGKVYDGVVLIPLFVRVAYLKAWTGVVAFCGLTPVFYLMDLTGNVPVMVAGSCLIVATTLIAAGALLRPQSKSYSTAT